MKTASSFEKSEINNSATQHKNTDNETSSLTMQKFHASHGNKQLDDNGCSEPSWAAEFLGRKKDI